MNGKCIIWVQLNSMQGVVYINKIILMTVKYVQCYLAIILAFWLQLTTIISNQDSQTEVR